MKALTQRDYLRVGEAASFLGVPEATLRNWDKTLKPIRHPINGYRLYSATHLQKLKRRFEHQPPGQQAFDYEGSAPPRPTPAVAPREEPRRVSDAAMHWRAEVALDPKHRPQLWNRPSSTVRRDWRKYPQEAHVLDAECRRYRRLTPAEIAVIQGFSPELAAGTGFSDRQVIGALGNAVPPAMARAVLGAVAEARSWRNRTALEVCAGIGGLAKGASDAGFEHLLCLDIDPVCNAFLRRLTEIGSPEIDSTDLRYARLSRFKGQVGLLSGGPPCQPWSTAGLRLGSEDDRDVLGEMPALVADVEPEAFVFENVAGLITGQNKRYFDRLVERLQAPARGLRYGVLAARFNAADFGLPQIRERVFVVGFRDEPAAAVHRCFDRVWEARTHRDPTLADRSRPEWRTLGEAIEPLSDPGGWRSWFGQSIMPDETDAE